MMMMLVSEIQDKSKNLIKFFKEEAIDIIHYSSPIKALDNLQEIAPDAVVVLEADKAVRSGVQGIVNVDSSSDSIVKNAQDILAKYKSITFKKGRGSVASAFPDGMCSFLFVEPKTSCIITGKVKDIKVDSILFIPDSEVEYLVEGTILSNCSFKVNDEILTPNMRVLEVGKYLNLEFDNIDENDAKIIANFVQEYSD